MSIKELKVILIICTVSLTNDLSGQNCLVANYQLDGNAVDYSGNNNNGILYGTLSTFNRFEIQNSALYFNGNYEAVYFPTDFDFPERAIVAWFKADYFPIGGAWVYDSDHPDLIYGHTSIYVENINSTNKISFCVGTNFIKFDSAEPDVWYMAVISVNIDSVRFYINGSKLQTIPNDNFLHSWDGDYNARIGTTRKNDRFFSGAIDDVRIYNCSLSDSAVLNLYHEGGWDITIASITSLLEDRIVCKDENTMFQVDAIGQYPIYYRWQKEGIDIPYATDSVLLINSAQASLAGNYRCIATNEFGSDTSNTAILYVDSLVGSEITGPEEVLEFDERLYSIPMNIGHVNQFFVEGGNIIELNENSVKIQWGSKGLGIINLVETNENGCQSDTVTKYVSIGVFGLEDLSDKINLQVAPNPFKDYLIFQYFLNEESTVQLEIYDSQGRSFVKLVDSVQGPGIHRSELKSPLTCNGIIFFKMRVDNDVFSGKVLHLND